MSLHPNEARELRIAQLEKPVGERPLERSVGKVAVHHIEDDSPSIRLVAGDTAFELGFVMAEGDRSADDTTSPDAA